MKVRFLFACRHWVLWFCQALTAAAALVPLIRSPAYAAWTPLVTADSFSGIQADVLTCAGGIVSVLLVLLGIGLLVKTLR